MSEAVERDEQRAAQDVLVEVDGLKTYYDTGFTSDPVRAVDGVSFDIKRGETLGLVGESGCGKTTLGRTLVQLESVTDGAVRFEGDDITTLRKKERKYWQRNAQIVFQDPESSLNERMTVGAIVREPLDVHDWPNLAVRVEGADAEVTGNVRAAEPGSSGRGVDITVRLGAVEPEVDIRDEIPLSADDVAVTVTEGGGGTTVDVKVRKSKDELRRAHVRELLETVGLREEHYYRYPHQFSGGQRQRVGIARALALEPEFVVLDEPVSALDVSVQAKILNLLEELQDEFGLTYLFIAHDLSVVRHICDRVAVMYLGNVMELGPTEELFEDPANPYTLSLLSAIPEPDPTLQKQRITLRGTPPSPRDPPDGCPFSTRCPAKIRPDEFADLDDELWIAIDVLGDIIRERGRADRSLREIARERLGLETRFSSVDEIVVEVFGRPEGVPADAPTAEQMAAALDELPPSTRGPLEDVVDHLRRNHEGRALERLHEAFGAECEASHPELHDVGEAGRASLCHRHKAGYTSPQELLSERYDF